MHDDSMKHVDEGTIHAWIDDALSPAEAARVAAHVQTCDECARVAAEARGLVAASTRILSALDDVPGGVIPESRPASIDGIVRRANAARSAHRRRWYNSAGAIAALLLVGVIGERAMRGTSYGELPGGPAAAHVVSPVPTVTATPAPLAASASPATSPAQKPTPPRALASPAHRAEPVSPSPAPDRREIAVTADSVSRVPPSSAKVAASGATVAAVPQASAEAASPRARLLQAQLAGGTANRVQGSASAADSATSLRKTAFGRIAHPVVLGVFAGTLPCADCPGIRTELTLTKADDFIAEGTYVLKETYLGRDSSRVTRGEWTTLRGDAADPDATVYQLEPDNPARSRQYLRIGNDDAIRMLDNDSREIGVPRSRWTLTRVRVSADSVKTR